VLHRDATLGQDDPANLLGAQRTNGKPLVVPGPGRNGWSAQPYAAGLGELLLSGRGERSRSHRGHPRLLSAPAVVGEAEPGAGVESFTLLGTVPAPDLRVDPARRPTSPPFVGERMTPCPRAGCGKSARPVR